MDAYLIQLIEEPSKRWTGLADREVNRIDIDLETVMCNPVGVN
jgi:hypothetical protein